MNENGINLELGTPELTLESQAQAPVIPEQKDITEHYLEEQKLSPEEQAQVDSFSEKIDLNDSVIILQYGAACQKKIAAFSDTALEGVRTKDLGETGDMIADLVTELKGFSVDEEDDGGFLGFFKKAGNKIAKLKARYDKAEINIDKIVAELEGHQNQLLKDIIMLDKMYAANLTYFKELTMYILAGKKKLYDLELTRTISIQMAPQIRLIQNNNTLMSEKIQSTINNTIPLWKNQMVLALGMAHSKEAMEAQRAVTDMTNELLKKNADALKQGTVDIARESERGIVDLETVQYTNQQLISTLDEVLKIQDEGRAKRRAAETELVRIESELKAKLLEIRE